MISSYKDFNLHNLSFIIHYRKDSPDREFNLRTILKYLRNNFKSEIIVINDERKIDNPPIWIKEWADKLLVCENDDEFRKAYCYNKAVKASNNDIFCFWDVDVLIDIKFIVYSYLSLRGWDKYDHFYPFNGTFLDVQKSKFDLLIPDPDFETLCGLWKDRKEGIDFASSVSPGGCNMITKEAFEKIGGYDERFVGWGFEDTDFMERSQLVNRLSRMNDNDAICWHMHHDQAIRENNPHYLNNLKIYRNNKK